MDVSRETLLLGKHRLLTKCDDGGGCTNAVVLSMIILNLRACEFRVVTLR
jgi:hypothetical protein